MATVNFLYRSTRAKAPLIIRLLFRHEGRDYILAGKTKYDIEKKDWEIFLKRSNSRDQVIKDLRKKIVDDLQPIESHILSAFNQVAESNIMELDKSWLELQIKNYYQPPTVKKTNPELVHWIERIIETANTRENSQKGLGLSKSRINSYKNLLKIIKAYQGNRTFLVKDVNIQFGKEFLTWMMVDRNYSESYARKKVDDLKTVCREAEIYGVDTSKQLGKVKGGKPKNDSIIYLSPKELGIIENTTLVSDAHHNARKWLLLGCNLGQRGSDLLKLNKSNFITRNGLNVIELKQQKTGKQVTIPILEETKEILKDGLPRPIAIQNFNTYIKEICKIAGLDELVEGAKVAMVDKNGKEIPKDENGKYIEKGVKRKVVGIFPKYDLITSHVCRRSFATNLYGILPTPLIMRITAHSTEKMFLNYIGKDSLDYAQQIADFYELQAQREKKESKLEVVMTNKNVSNN